MAKIEKAPNRKIKRIMDLAVCLLALPVAVPLGVVLSAAISLDSKGSPFYLHRRIGRGGKEFMLLKFRTMEPDADRILEEYLRENPEMAEEWANTQKLRQDPRVTRIGHFLRKTSLDEVPQILNILKGDMSLVGPRPIVDAEKEKYGKRFAEYCSMNPGLTGVWQVSGRSDTTYERRLACDHYYAHNWSCWLDLKILAKTVLVAIKGFGAY